jgi:hypothetical protein
MIEVAVKEKEYKKDRYWIDTGVEVIHRDYPKRKMIVDKVIKRSIEDFNDNTKRKTYTIGVDCHWLDEHGVYGQGRFLTMELLPYNKLNNKVF